MERRALLAAVISLAILIGYQGFILPWLFPPVAEPVQEETVAAAPANPAAAAGNPERAAAQVAPPADAAPVVPERLVTVETDNYIATLSTRGARFTSFALKDYRTSVEAGSPYREMILPTVDGRQPIGVELRGARDGGARTIVLPDVDAAYTINVATPELTLSGEQQAELKFTWTGAEATVHKTFTFRGDRPDFGIDLRTENVAARYTEIAVTYASATKSGHEKIYDRASYYQGKKLTELHLGASDLTDGEIVSADPPLAWATLGGIYFTAALIPEDPTGARLWLKQRDDDLEQKLLFPLDATGFARQFEVYLGSKRMETLEAVGHNLSRSVDMGWFSIIAVPLLWVLRKSHSLTSNYGVDIILLTVMIKLAFLPLTRKSFQSMKAMQQIQPQMNELRERHKDDSQALNREMMELFKRHKVNPFGGCLPMIVQIPVFVGLYQALSNAVELRHAPFALWITDLSAPDRLGDLAIPFVDPPGIPVLTLFMGGSMFVQQWMTPSTGDAQQRQMMLLMPLIFTFMFLNFPAGLSLYWTVSNILTVAQQYYINRSVK